MGNIKKMCFTLRKTGIAYKDFKQKIFNDLVMESK